MQMMLALTIARDWLPITTRRLVVADLPLVLELLASIAVGRLRGRHSGNGSRK